jgi:hypothetical protein
VTETSDTKTSTMDIQQLIGRAHQLVPIFRAAIENKDFPVVLTTLRTHNEIYRRYLAVELGPVLN